MSASQNNMSFIVNQQDANGVNIINRTFTGPYAGLAGQFIDGLLTTTGATAISLPTANALQMFIQNNGSTGFITVSWTPLAATGSVIAGKIGPSGFLGFSLCSSGSSQGISALSLTADTLNTPFSCFIGG